jgi:transketolase
MSLSIDKKQYLEELCKKFRIDVIDTLHNIQTGHPGGSLSVCEILTTLYFDKVNVNPKDPKWENRDRVVLCKGHAAPMLYRVLAEKGFFEVEEMKTLRQLNSRLQGHPNAAETPGVEVSTGPLGIGLPAALGIAVGLRLSNIDSYVYAVLGDGELNEGVVWEAAMSASKFKADNLIAIVDWNGVQLDGTTNEILPSLDLNAKFKAFGWNVLECDGHNVSELSEAIDTAKEVKGLPTVILAHTVKGKGVSFMEGKNIWHGRPINDEEFKLAMSELGGAQNE